MQSETDSPPPTSAEMDRSLVEFYRKFKQQIEPPNVPPGAVLKNPDVQVVLERRFFDLPAADLSAYQAKILRTVVERIQNAIGDEEDEVGPGPLVLDYR